MNGLARQIDVGNLGVTEVCSVGCSTGKRAVERAGLPPYGIAFRHGLQLLKYVTGHYFMTKVLRLNNIYR